MLGGRQWGCSLEKVGRSISPGQIKGPRNSDLVINKPSEDPTSMPPLSPNLKIFFTQLIQALRGWCACIDCFSQNSQLWKYIAKCDSLITNEEIRNLKTSKPHIKGVKIIQLADMGPALNLRWFSLARDYLPCRLTLATGTQPQALNNVLILDYEFISLSILVI